MTLYYFIMTLYPDDDDDDDDDDGDYISPEALPVQNLSFSST